jgi:hypothetical protein
VIGDYATPQAFRSALEARLRNLAQQRGIDLRRLYRWVAFERLLARLSVPASPPWVLKGGYALEVRFDNRARATLDLDLTLPDPASWAQEVGADVQASWTAFSYEHLQQAAAQPLNDGFEFRLAQPKLEQTGAPGGGVRCAVEARLAGAPLPASTWIWGWAIRLPRSWSGSSHTACWNLPVSLPHASRSILWNSNLPRKSTPIPFPGVTARIRGSRIWRIWCCSSHLGCWMLHECVLHCTPRSKRVGRTRCPMTCRRRRLAGPLPMQRWRRSLRSRRQR